MTKYQEFIEYKEDTKNVITALTEYDDEDSKYYPEILEIKANNIRCTNLSDKEKYIYSNDIEASLNSTEVLHCALDKAIMNLKNELETKRQAALEDMSQLYVRNGDEEFAQEVTDIALNLVADIFKETKSEQINNDELNPTEQEEQKIHEDCPRNYSHISQIPNPQL